MIASTLIILYVKDQTASMFFYEKLLQQPPSLHVEGMTEFDLSPGIKLGLMPESGISKILCPKLPDPSTGSGIPRCELYLVCDEIEPYRLRAIGLGGTSIQETRLMDWGHSVAYVSDLDGHILAFAKVK